MPFIVGPCAPWCASLSQGRRVQPVSGPRCCGGRAATGRLGLCPAIHGRCWISLHLGLLYISHTQPGCSRLLGPVRNAAGAGRCCRAGPAPQWQPVARPTSVAPSYPVGIRQAVGLQQSVHACAPTGLGFWSAPLRPSEQKLLALRLQPHSAFVVRPWASSWRSAGGRCSSPATSCRRLCGRPANTMCACGEEPSSRGGRHACDHAKGDMRPASARHRRRRRPPLAPPPRCRAPSCA